MTGKRRHGTESNWSYRLMALSYRIRDARSPHEPILAETAIQQGDAVLDFGCGPGSYVLPAARMTGPEGHVYALDRHPLAIRMTSHRTRKAGLSNVSTLHSSLATSLADLSVDVVLLYDTYHHLEEPGVVLRDIHRVLKRTGLLSAHDHHLGRTALKKAIEGTQLLQLVYEGAYTLQFAPKRT